MKQSLFIVLFVCPAAVFAQSPTEFAQIGDWAIKVNPANGNGCFMQRSYDNGTLVQIGADPSLNGAFFAAYNAGWDLPSEGTTADVLFDFGDSRFQGEVKQHTHLGVHGGYAFFDNPEFISEFGKRNSVLVQGPSGRSEELDLSGSKKALEHVKMCQESPTNN
ncbi:MAG: hypothetical protein ABJO67_07460 [Pseudoruegeria sp.]